MSTLNQKYDLEWLGSVAKAHKSISQVNNTKRQSLLSGVD